MPPDRIPGSQRAAPRMLDVLANREFRGLWVAEALSIAGDQLAKVALAILVYGRTGSALWAALVYAMTFFPALAGGLGLSQLADRYPRRSVILTCAVIQACLIALMIIPGMPLVALCALVFLVALVSAPANAAQNAETREVFTDDALYLRSQDLRGITLNTMMLLGLAGGGLLAAGLGTHWALTIDALTFVAAALIVRAHLHWRPSAAGPADRWFDGARLVLADRRLRVLIGLSWLVGLTVVPEGLAAPLADQMDAPDHAVGWLLAADPLGFIIGAFVLSRYVTAETRERCVGVLAFASPAVLVGFALGPSLPVALVLLGLSGAAGAYIITVTATFTTLVPNEVRAGATGIYRTGLRVAQGFGVALGGVVATWLTSAMATTALAGMLGAFAAVPVALAWSRHRHEHTLRA